MNQKPTRATVTSIGWKGIYTTESEDKRVLHIESNGRGRPLNIGDKVLCDGITFCSGDAIASKYRVLARANQPTSRL